MEQAISPNMLDSILAPMYQQWIVQSLLVTLAISVITIAASSVLGVLLAFLRCLPVKLISVSTLLLGSIFRDTPLLLQLLFWYIAGPEIFPSALIDFLRTEHDLHLFGVALGWPSFEFIVGCFGLTIYSAVFIAEDIRSGVLSVKKEQTEAALALGMTSVQALRIVVIPQALRAALPAIFGQYMNVVKNSSLTMAIAVNDISNIAFKINDETGKTFTAFAVATVLYVVINAFINLLANWRERNRLQVA